MGRGFVAATPALIALIKGARVVVTPIDTGEIELHVGLLAKGMRDSGQAPLQLSKYERFGGLEMHPKSEVPVGMGTLSAFSSYCS